MATTPLEYGTFKHGAVTFPLPSSTAKTLLVDADIALSTVILYFAAMLELHIGARLTAQATLAGLSWPKAVALSVPYDPEPYLLDAYLGFPLLAVYRNSDVIDDRTVQWRETVSEWSVDYVLPPLSAAQAETLGPILNTVGRVLDYAATTGGDASYLLNASVWETCELSRIRFLRATYGRWEKASGHVFHAFRGTLEVSERTAPVTGAFGAMSAVVSTIQIEAPDEDPVTV